MEEFKAITTQEAFDAAIKERLERNTRSVTDEVKKQFEGYQSPDDAKKAADQIAALTQQLADQKQTAADLTAKVHAHEINSTKLKIAHETGIPYELAQRLSGETEEDIRKDAETLSRFTAHGQPTPDFSPEQPAQSSKNAAYIALAQSLKGK